MYSRQLRSQGRNGYRTGFRPGVRSVAQFQDRLQDIAWQTSKTPVIVYVLARPEQLDLILITPEGEPIYVSVPDAPQAEITRVARDFRIRITSPRQRHTESYLRSAQQLYQWIIAPLEEHLEAFETDTLVLSMDEGLRALPIAALHDGEQFLVEKYSLGLIPTINLTDTSYQPLQNANVLAMGASAFNESEQRALPTVPIELSTIVRNSALAPAQNIDGLWEGKSFLNDEFTFGNLQQLRNDYPFDILHLATHAEFQSGESGRSYIQLWDRKLDFDDLRQLGWHQSPVELLVLSACRTAVGNAGREELGFAGLAIRAGVKSVLASLWYVSDEGTLGLMSEFYRQLRLDDVTIKSEALRQAQIAMLRGELRIEDGQLIWPNGKLPLPPELSSLPTTDFSHPYYWSGFTMVGSPW